MTKHHNNQDPKFYSKDYYLTSCAGSAEFKLGEDSHHPLYQYLFNNIKVEVKDKNVLDLGCGRGELCIASARKGARKVVGLDFSCDAINIAKKHLSECGDLKNKSVEFILGNALEHQFEEKYDVIFLTDIIEHLYDDQLSLLFKNVKNHLSETGVIVIHTMPTKEFIMFGQYLKFITYFIRGKKHHFLTFANQAAETHVNLHHKEQLARHLTGLKYKIWYDFADQGKLKRILSKTPITRLLSGNLWATAQFLK
jgi:2-polyprenyl-3-methyl-5-hydroxy-6-metoxy-1,4-benzoquinol methylase